MQNRICHNNLVKAFAFISDFTEEEVKLMVDAGATPVGLGPCRLRVETATIAMLSTVMLWSDALKLET